MGMTDIRNFDSSYSPSERFEGNPIPECMECNDEGMVHGPNDTQDFCGCEVGLAHEQSFLDYCDATEDSLDDYADSDALASAGMGTDEDYGCYDSGEYF